MNTVSAYIFRQALGPLLAILGALAAIAILTQGLNQLDIIITNRRAGWAFAWVTILALPQLISLILPMAVFIATVYALNRMQGESEIAVLYGAGVSRRRIARPILQLATLAALAHLAINVVVQPWSFTERRETLFALRTDIASSLIEEGSFTFPAENLTLYARERGGSGELRDLLINDARPEYPITYTARAGAIVTIDGAPAVVMRDGQIQRQTEEGTVDVLDFDRYVLQMGTEMVEEPGYFFLKASDRTLYELFFPDLTSHYDQRNVDQFLAEAHARLSAPLLNIALAMVALAGVLVGEFSRRGYARRIMIAAVWALVVRLAALAIQAAAAEDPQLNALQYALPIIVIVVCAVMLGGKRARRRRQSLGPSVLTEAPA
ncbi:MAG TPA: LptF/LptG family permease [Vitreimonas sp.]|uniref:LptF/LptG family permease n=1 Tax=Vitreimonas sp. TaxID=3069702 RepID=UPI002D458A74|nr:LptF/LptG family permease [Vitreimonas sp.]HYD89509.1 LptF/LptG family permease [Vitreimonas sp.]